MHAVTINDLAFRSCGGRLQGTPFAMSRLAQLNENLSRDWSYGRLDDPTSWGFRIRCRCSLHVRPAGHQTPRHLALGDGSVPVLTIGLAVPGRAGCRACRCRRTTATFSPRMVAVHRAGPTRAGSEQSEWPTMVTKLSAAVTAAKTLL